jgi:hypothetical protein
MLTTSPMIPSLRFGTSCSGLAINWLGGRRPKERHGVLLNPISVINQDSDGTWVARVGLFT